MTDPEAIAPPEKPVEMVTMQGKLATGKSFALSLPADCDALDGMCLHAVVDQAFNQLQQMQAQRHGAIALPNGALHVVRKPD